MCNLQSSADTQVNKQGALLKADPLISLLGLRASYLGTVLVFVGDGGSVKKKGSSGVRRETQGEYFGRRDLMYSNTFDTMRSGCC